MKSLKVKEYMSTRLITFKADTNVVAAMAVLLKEKISGAPVLDDDDNLVGVLSEVDIMQVIVQDSYYDESTGIVGDFMHSPAEVVAPDMDIYTLAERFIQEGRRRYPVVSNGRLVGQISRRDVLRAVENILQHKN